MYIVILSLICFHHAHIGFSMNMLVLTTSMKKLRFESRQYVAAALADGL